MANSTNQSTTEQSYEFDLTYSDILAAMNSPQVLLAGGNIQSTQNFQLVLRKANGNEISLKEFAEGDTLAFRFKKVTQNTVNTNYNGISIRT